MAASTQTLDDAPSEALPSIPGCNVLAVLGRGAAGTVYRARQTAHARDVAVRVFDPASPHAAGFLGAVRTVGAVTHPNLVRIFEVGDHQGRPFVMTEFVSDGSLADRIEAAGGGGMPWREAVRIVHLAAAGLAHVHASGLVHGAVRPSNVLLRPEGHVKLADLGVVAPPGEDADASRCHAPEMTRGEPPTAASDVWSLGATLWFALTGSSPEVSADGPPAAIESVRRDLPTEVVETVDAMLAFDPEARPADVEKVRRRLGVALNGKESLVDVRPDRKRQGVDKRLLAGIAAVVLVGAGAWLAQGHGRSAAAATTVKVEAAVPNQSEAARRLAELRAREKALGTLCASNIDPSRKLADDYGVLARDYSIDEPAVAEAWGRRRALLRLLSAVVEDDRDCARRADAWIAEALADLPAARAAAGPKRDARDLKASRESAVKSAEELIEAARFDEGLGGMAAWLVGAKASARGDADEAALAEIQQGAEWLRASAVATAMRLKADLDVDGEILRAHWPETSCFGGRGENSAAPDFERSRTRTAAVAGLLSTGPARDRASARLNSIQMQSAVFHVVWRSTRPAPDASRSQTWRSAVADVVESEFNRLPPNFRAGAVLLLVECGDAERAGKLLARATSLDAETAASVGAECDALEAFAKVRASKDEAGRPRALATWGTLHAATDASLVLAAGDGAVHPGIPPADADKFLEAWGRIARPAAGTK